MKRLKAVTALTESSSQMSTIFGMLLLSLISCAAQ